MTSFSLTIIALIVTILNLFFFITLKQELIALKNIFMLIEKGFKHQQQFFAEALAETSAKAKETSLTAETQSQKGQKQNNA